jgi:hypothetical protein
VGTLDADYPLYVATGGTDEDTAIPGFDVGQSADTLYVTNGETNDGHRNAAHRLLHLSSARGYRGGIRLPR